MRRALGLAIFVAGLAGCSSSPTAPSTDPAAGISPDFSAITFTTSDKFDIGLIAFIPCANAGAGEFVDFSGTLHEVFHTTINGSSFVQKIHDQPQGLKGVGEITGAVWNATGVTQDRFRSGTVGFTETFINNFKLIGPGTGNDLLIHENLHITVNGNGTLKVFRDHVTVSCK
jgi:hypothetical protein